MTTQEKKTVNFIYNVTAAAVFIVGGVTLALAYFDVLTK
jgi:heme/copper-type cytochrome/quinol oxidase subunit 2